MSRAWTLAEGASQLAPELGSALAGGIAGADCLLWRDVIVERWLAGSRSRYDLMGALTDPATLTYELRATIDWLDHPLVAAWLDPKDPLPSSVLWFEWDEPTRRSGPRPLVSACVSERVLGEESSRRVPIDGSARARLIERVLAAFAAQAEAGALAQACELLSCSGELLHIASLSPRGGVGLRLVFGMLAGQVMGWLQRCGWPGPRAQLSAILAASAPPFVPIGVQVELRDGAMGSYVGVETPEYFSRPSSDQFRAWAERLASFGCEVEEARLELLVGRLGARPEARGAMADRVYLKAAYATGWQAKAYSALGSVAREPLAKAMG